MKLGVIGCGKMGSALVGGIIRSELCAPSDVTVYDTYEPAAAAMAADLGVTRVNSNAEVVVASEAILLCVKPQGFPEMLADLGDSRRNQNFDDRKGDRLAAPHCSGDAEHTGDGGNGCLRLCPRK